jgi:hypothetical protein
LPRLQLNDKRGRVSSREGNAAAGNAGVLASPAQQQQRKVRGDTIRLVPVRGTRRCTLTAAATEVARGVSARQVQIRGNRPGSRTAPRRRGPGCGTSSCARGIARAFAAAPPSLRRRCLHIIHSTHLAKLDGSILVALEVVAPLSTVASVPLRRGFLPNLMRDTSDVALLWAKTVPLLSYGITCDSLEGIQEEIRTELAMPCILVLTLTVPRIVPLQDSTY